MTNRIQESFEQIKAPQPLKESTMKYLQGERRKRSRRRTGPVWRAALAGCAALALFLGAGVYMVRTPVSYISIDVNPSLELALNCFDRVVSVTPYNEDGEMLLEGLKVEGRFYADAIDLIVESDGMQKYLTEEAALTFTVASGSEAREGMLLTGIEQSSGCTRYGGTGCHADVSTVSDAHSNGMSFGKYAAYLILSEYDDTIGVEDCSRMTMAEIQSQICAHENHAGESCHENHGGQGYGMQGSAAPQESVTPQEDSAPQENTAPQEPAADGNTHHPEPEHGHGYGHH